MQKAMNAVSSENRKMEGGLIWLGLIPILNIVWPFIFNSALRSSYKKEFADKGINQSVNLATGFIYPGAQILSILIYAIGGALAEELVSKAMYYGSESYAYDAANIAEFTLIFMSVFGLVSLVTWIVFWVNVNGLRSALESHGLYVARNITINQQTAYSEPLQQNTAQFNNPMEHVNPDKTQTTSTATMVAPEPKSEPAKQVSSIDKLMKYHDMLSEGLITQADFDKVKNELLNQK
jgi:hypothetical protein